MSARRHFIDNIRWPMIILVVSMHGPILAEDLGVITDDVVALRKGFGLPGMRVLQFAFSGEGDNPHLPNMHGHDSVQKLVANRVHFFLPDRRFF